MVWLTQRLQRWLLAQMQVQVYDLHRNQTALALEIVLLKQAMRLTPDVMPNPATARASKEPVFEPTMGRL